jgi:hypothetical protein
MSISQQAGFELALTHFVEGCPAFADCPLAGNPAVDLPRIHAVLEQFQARPVAGGEPAQGRLMTGQALKTGMIQALYSESLWPALSTLLAEVLRPAPVTEMAWQLADMYNDFTPGVGFATNIQDALWAIYCVDYPVERDPAVLAELNARLAAAAPTLTLDLPPVPDAVCAQWPFEYRGGQHGRLTGVLVTFEGEGHTAYSRYGDACVVAAVDGYLLRGVVPKDGTWCRSM